MPLTFNTGMEISTETSSTVIPHAPNFVRQGGCGLSGQVEFLPLASNRPGAVQLSYVVDIECSASSGQTPAETGGARTDAHTPSIYRVRFGFVLMDADGFQLRYVRSGYHLLSPDESYSFRGFVDQSLTQDLADRVKAIDCRLCFEGIEVP
jgi:hypothetical protein